TSAAMAGRGPVTLGEGVTVFPPTADYDGPTSFEYTISDGQGGSATATVGIAVTAVNDAPVAKNASVDVTFDVAANGDLSATDVDNAAAQLTFAGEGDAANGSVDIDADGHYTYTPDAGFAGVDSFTFRVTDAGGLTSTATVSLTVVSVNGTGGNDSLTGTAQGDFIDGLAGDDTIDGGA